MNFNVALLQIAPGGNDWRRNLAKGLDFCRKAKALGADLVVFPELWSMGSARPPRDLQRWIDSAVASDSGFVRAFMSLARELRLNIAISYLGTHRPKPKNTVSIINGQGEEILRYSKVFICDFEPGDGDNEIGCDVHCSAGDSFPVCTLTGAQGEVRLGAMICADREFPEPASRLMFNGAELIVVPNACDWDEMHSAGLLTRAVENLVGIAMVNYPRPLNNGYSRAYTCVAWKDGKAQNPLIASAGEQEELLIAEFDVDAVRKFRLAEAWRLNHRNRLSNLGTREA